MSGTQAQIPTKASAEPHPDDAPGINNTFATACPICARTFWAPRNMAEHVLNEHGEVVVENGSIGFTTVKKEGGRTIFTDYFHPTGKNSEQEIAGSIPKTLHEGMVAVLNASCDIKEVR